MITPSVFGIGPRTTSIALVGEAPGYNEAKLRRPFIGRAGELLTRLLHASNIPRSDVYITNVIKERPGKDDNDLSGWFKSTSGKVWTSEGFREYTELLRRELSQLPNLTVVIPLGNAALYALCSEVAITKRRGSILPSTLIPGLKCVPTIHPAFALREYLNEHLIKHDFMRALEESRTKEISLLPREILIEPSFHDCVDFLIKCNNTTELGCDIEVMNEEISCISVSINPQYGISIPFVYNGNDYFTPDQELTIWKLLSRMLANKDITKIGHNFIFDMSFILRKYNIIINNYHCTMIAQGIAYPDFPKGLDFVTSVNTREPYYKDDGKKWFRTGGSYHKFWTYNAKDSLVCQEAFPELMKKIVEQGNQETYEEQRKLIPPLIFMQTRGMRVNVDGLRSASKQAEDKITEKILDMAKLQECEVALKIEKEPDVYKVTDRSNSSCILLTKSEFTKYCKQNPTTLNIASTQQLAELFYTKLGNAPYKDKGHVTTNDDALKRLVRKGIKEAIITRDIRKIVKLKGTYYDMKMSSDNRLRSSMNPIGAVSGRLSSSQDIFGEGGNVQNLPLIFQQFVLADDGYVMYIPDLSQAENRTTANIAPEPLMLKAFAEDVDIHSLTGGMISGLEMDEVKRQDKEGINCALGTGEYPWRFWGKKCKLRTCEVLTYGGWISIESAYILNADIAQWDIDGNISFIKPSRWFAENYTGEICVLENQRIFQEGTPDHKMPVYYSNRDERRFMDKSMSDYPSSGHHFAPLSGFYKEGNITLPSYIIKLMVAFQADGSWNGQGMNIRVFKERKVKRLQEIILSSNGNIPFNPETGYISAKCDAAKFIAMTLGKKKLFGKWLLELSQESLNIFLNELCYWDGYSGNETKLRDQYFTTVKENAEWVQTVAHLCGKAALIHEQRNADRSNAYGDKILYIVAIRNSTMPASNAIRKHTHRVVDEPIFCPTVPSGYFLCRERGIISVTGNCNHSLNYDLGYKSFALRFEMPETQAKMLVDRFHRVYPGIRQYHAWVRNLLQQNRRLVNCFGRVRVFMDRWGDDLFKEAYSWIPQSTIADKMNRQGINYIYYNPELFPSLELLNQIHDSLVFQIPVSVGWKEHARMLLLIKKSLETPMSWHGKEFMIPLEFKFGLNMRDTKKVGIPDDETVGRLADKLHEIYSKLGASRPVPSVEKDIMDVKDSELEE